MAKYLIKTIKLPDYISSGDHIGHEDDWLYIDSDKIHAIRLFGKEFKDSSISYPIVRCKDCKYWRYDDCQNDSHGYCPTNENDFCSRGERKDGGENG